MFDFAKWLGKTFHRNVRFTQRPRLARQRKTPLWLEQLEDRITPTVTINLDTTTYGANTVFAPGSPALTALQQAKQVLENSIGGTLAMVPQGQMTFKDFTLGQVTVSHPTIGPNEIYVYVKVDDAVQGGWASEGVESSANPRVSPQGFPLSTGGLIEFSTADAKLASIPLFDHELGHVLGLADTFPQSPTPWDKLTQNNSFIGTKAEEIYGGPVPLDTSFPGHWAPSADQSPDPNQTLLNMHATMQEIAEVPFRPLDFAALADLGYTLSFNSIRNVHGDPFTSAQVNIPFAQPDLPLLRPAIASFDSADPASKGDHFVEGQGGPQPILGVVRGDYIASIDWGDKSPRDTDTFVWANGAGGFDVLGNHAYGQAGTYTVKILIQDLRLGAFADTTSTIVATGSGTGFMARIGYVGAHGLSTQGFQVGADGVLHVAGDQLADKNDTVILDASGTSILVAMNGELAQFDRATLTGVEVSGGTGNDTIDLMATLATAPAVINVDGGTTTVNVTPTSETLGDLAGGLTINGDGTTHVILDGQNDPAGETYTVTGSTLASKHSAVISYNNIQDVTVNGGTGGDTYNVQGTAAGTATTVKTQGGSTVNVGSQDPAADGIVDNIQGTLTVQGAGSDTLNVNDQGSAGRQEYDVYSDRITREPITTPPTGPTQTIAYAGLADVVVNGSDGSSDVFFALGTPAGTALSLNAGSGGANEFEAIDEYNPADTSPGTDNLLGPVAFHGHNNDYGVRYDYYDGAGHTFTFGASGAVSTLQRDGAADLTYDGLYEMVVYVPTVGGNRLNVQGVAPGVFLDLTLSAGDRAVVGSLAPGLGGTTAAVLGSVAFEDEVAGVTSAVTVDDSGDASTAARRVTVAPPPADPTPSEAALGSSVFGLSGAPDLGVYWRLNSGSSVALRGGAGAETFALQGALPDVALRIDGGGGSNTLDYSGYTGDIQVNLLLGTATGVAGGISRIENVVGSQGNDLIVGDANANTLIGGTGRNVLIGGAGPDTLDASRSSGDNLLIGGTTDFGSNPPALEAIFAEWTRTDLSFRDRFSDLTSGTNGAGATPLNQVQVNGQLSQLILLTPTTVHADSSPDALKGSNQTDPATGKRVHNWFFYDADDVLINYLGSSDHKTKVK
jgi:hypothetical protein